MRLKVLPGDFRVREVLEFPHARDGLYRIHRLQKEKLTTVEALTMVAREARVSREAIAHAGLKDRQAITEQWISVRGREVDIQRSNLRVSLVGRSADPITSKMSSGNQFSIVLRDLDPSAASTVRRNLPSLKKTGFPNYFDDQRFGCLKHGQGFIMRQILRGDYEGALRQLLASPSEVAIAGDVKLKRILQRLWGDWDACAETARGIYRTIFRHLINHRGDFRGALELVPLRLRLIHAFAFQSYIWNLALSRLVWGMLPASKRVALNTRAGVLCAWRYMAQEDWDRLVAMDTPLYGPEGSSDATPFVRETEGVLRREGLRAEDFLAHRVKGMVWQQESRPAVVVPRDLKVGAVARDEIHQGRSKLQLSFALPRGAYATMLIKRLFAGSMFSENTSRRGRPRRRRPPDAAAASGS